MRIDLLIEEQLKWSRKKVKQAFQSESVMINGNVVTNRAFSVEGRLHQVNVKDKIITVPKHQYLMLNKSKGIVTANQDKKFQTVIDLIKEPAQDLFSIGRLDRNTTGLILLTNNGPFGYYLTQDKFAVRKKYFVRVNRKLTSELIELFNFGIIFTDGYQCASAKLKILDDYIAEVTIAEGKRHQIKKMFLAVGYYVEELHRLQIGSLSLDKNLIYGMYRELTLAELKELYYGYTVKEGI